MENDTENTEIIETNDNNNTNSTDNTSYISEKKGISKWVITILVLIGLMLILAAGTYVWVHQINIKKNAAGIGLKNANIKIDTLDNKVTDLVIQLDTTRQRLEKEMILNEVLKKENDSLRNLFPIQIRKLEVANVDSTGNTISSYGESVVAAKSMYLMPRITYYSFKPGEKVELLIKLYDNDGDCITGDNSPNGFSYSYVIDYLRPGENILSLSGWGGPDMGHFQPGTYRFEIWYKDMCLKYKTFKLI